MTLFAITAEFVALERDLSVANGALLEAASIALGIVSTKPKGPPASAPEPFWKKPGGLLLRDVWYDPKEDVFVMGYEPAKDQAVLGPELVRTYNLRSRAVLESCSTCHR